MVIKEDGYQPYFRAFILHQRLKIGDEVTGHEYITWNMNKWSEWRKLNGIPQHFPATPEHHRAFGKWLFETIPA